MKIKQRHKPGCNTSGNCRCPYRVDVRKWGQRFRISLKTADFKKAEKLGADYERSLSRQVTPIKKTSAEGAVSMKQFVQSYRHNAKRRRIDINLTPGQFISVGSGNCYYCGIAPNPASGLNGIDRVDSAKGYELGNVVPCCKMCNWAKRDFTTEEFFAWVARLVSFQLVRAQFASPERPAA